MKTMLSLIKARCDENLFQVGDVIESYKSASDEGTAEKTNKHSMDGVSSELCLFLRWVYVRNGS